MAINKNLVVAVGIAGLVLVVANMGERKKQEETPGELINQDLEKGKADLASLERRFDALAGEREENFQLGAKI